MKHAQILSALALFFALISTQAVEMDTDPYLWLEDIDGAKALAWVHEQNGVTSNKFTARPSYAGLYRDALSVLDAKSRIPEVHQRLNVLYNFWRDPDHPRGIY